MGLMHLSQKNSNNIKAWIKIYVKHTVKEFYKFNPIQVEIEMQDKIMKVDAFLLSIANTSEFGNRFKLSPKSSVQDGILEMIIIKPFPKWVSPFWLLVLLVKKETNQTCGNHQI